MCLSEFISLSFTETCGQTSFHATQSTSKENVQNIKSQLWKKIQGRQAADCNQLKRLNELGLLIIVISNPFQPPRRLDEKTRKD